MLTVHDVGLNPLRAGILDVLERMGVRVGTCSTSAAVAGELIGDVEVSGGAARRDPDRGRRGAAPRRRAAAGRAARHVRARDHARSAAPRSCARRRATGSRRSRRRCARSAVHIEARPDGFVVRGVPARPRGGTIDAAGDHRIAMLGAVAGAVSREGVRLGGAECAAVSFPGFFDLLDSVIQR